jgi:hypothetical protein
MGFQIHGSGVAWMVGRYELSEAQWRRIPLRKSTGLVAIRTFSPFETAIMP